MVEGSLSGSAHPKQLHEAGLCTGQSRFVTSNWGEKKKITLCTGTAAVELKEESIIV